MRKGYRETYPLGYRLSSGTALTEPRPYDENYMALVISILTNKTSGQALTVMGLTPEANGEYVPSYINIAEPVYMLYGCCGLTIRETTSILHVSKETVTKALEYAGIDREKRYRRRYHV